MADGKKVDLENDRTSALKEKDGTQIEKGAGTLRYQAGEEKKEAKPLYNTVEIPRGGEYNLFLADGTRVYLNSMSSLKFPVRFSGKTREVKLTGEAYFEVAKNELLPFTVRTGDLDVVALGTKFNVKAYREEGIIETTLVEGKISIYNNRHSDKHRKNNVFLEPHQKAVYVKDQQELRIVEINDIKRIIPEFTFLK